MKLTIKFSTINIVVLSELYTVIKPKYQNFNDIMNSIKKYVYNYYRYGEKSKYINNAIGPNVVETLSYKIVKDTAFKYLFSWPVTKEGYIYWFNIYKLIKNYYETKN